MLKIQGREEAQKIKRKEPISKIQNQCAAEGDVELTCECAERLHYKETKRLKIAKQHRLII